MLIALSFVFQALVMLLEALQQRTHFAVQRTGLFVGAEILFEVRLQQLVFAFEGRVGRLHVQQVRLQFTQGHQVFGLKKRATK